MAQSNLKKRHALLEELLGDLRRELQEGAHKIACLGIVLCYSHGAMEQGHLPKGWLNFHARGTEIQIKICLLLLVLGCVHAKLCLGLQGRYQALQNSLKTEQARLRGVWGCKNKDILKRCPEKSFSSEEVG